MWGSWGLEACTASAIHAAADVMVSLHHPPAVCTEDIASTRICDSCQQFTGMLFTMRARCHAALPWHIPCTSTFMHVRHLASHADGERQHRMGINNNGWLPHFCFQEGAGRAFRPATYLRAATSALVSSLHDVYMMIHTSRRPSTLWHRTPRPPLRGPADAAVRR